MKAFLSIILIFLISWTSGQEINIPLPDLDGPINVVLIQPTGNSINGLPEMVMIPDTSEIQRKVDHIVANSFITDAVELYYLASTYLKNKKKIDLIPPAYLALTKNDGGYARVGFYLLTKRGHIDLTSVPYIDLTEGRINGDMGKLMSITQLYPHEMGHVIYRMLNPRQIERSSRSVDMHYFSVRTDYSTAFNEGFAEHIENVSRIFETNENIRKGISEDTERIKFRSLHSINGFVKDLIYPFRIGYYKMSMPIWYQKYENLKRYEHATNGDIKYLNSTFDLPDIEDRIMIRNAGLREKKELRNYVQTLSTEGCINSFFTRLSQSKLADHYAGPDFYRYFLKDTSAAFRPEQVFTPIQNQFLKYFVVIHEYMGQSDSTGSEFIDFMEGYFKAFPMEEASIKEIFKEVTGLQYTNNLPPPLWLLIKNHSHRILVSDPYASLTLPIYTFDLNAAEVEDLLTIKGLQEAEARRLIEYRQLNGFFSSLDQLKEIKGVSKESVDLIINSEYNEGYLDDIIMPKLSFKTLLLKPIQRLCFIITGFFIVIMGLTYIFFLRHESISIRKMTTISFIYLLQWILFALGGLVLANMSSNSWQPFAMLSILILILNYLYLRKDETGRRRSIFAMCLMSLIVFISLI